MSQLHGLGNLAKTVLKEGWTVAKHPDLPLGYYLDNGRERYRYGYVQSATSGVKNGKLVGTVGTSGLAITGAGYWESCKSNPGFGASIGDKVIKIHSATIIGTSGAKYTDGVLFLISGTAKGHAYRVESVENGSANKTSKIFLKDELRVALAGSTMQARLYPNPYYGLKIVTSAKASCIPKGFIINNYSGGVTSTGLSGYGFIQARGLGIGIAKDTVVTGEALLPTASGKLSGQVGVTLSGPTVAYAVTGATTGNFLAIDINIE